MQNQLQTFSNENFGSVRVLGDSQNPLFCASDVCKVLGYQNGKDTISRVFGDGVVNCYPIIDTLGRKQEAKFFTESQLYKFIMRSNKENGIWEPTIYLISQNTQSRSQKIGECKKSLKNYIKNQKKIFS